MNLSDILLDRAWSAYEHGIAAEEHDLNLADMWFELMSSLIYQYAIAIVMEADND